MRWLLVMLILAIPIAAHQVEVDLPSGGNGIAPEQQIALTILTAATLDEVLPA